METRGLGTRLHRQDKVHVDEGGTYDGGGLRRAVGGEMEKGGGEAASELGSRRS